MAELLEETYTDGFLVLHQGTIVAEHYFNGMVPDVPHLLMSVSKSVTSAVAGVLAGRGELTASARVEEIVPELGGTSFAGTTVQDLLDMRAGTRFDESYDNPEADVRTYERVYLWRAQSVVHDLPGASRVACEVNAILCPDQHRLRVERCACTCGYIPAGCAIRDIP